jgi:hypothetical protein
MVIIKSGLFVGEKLNEKQIYVYMICYKVENNLHGMGSNPFLEKNN